MTKKKVNAARTIEKKIDESSLTKKVDAPARTEKVDTQSRKTKKVVTSDTTTTQSRTEKVGTQSKQKKKAVTPNTTTNVNVESRKKKGKKVVTPSTGTTEKKARKTVNAASVNKNVGAPRMTEKFSGQSMKKEKVTNALRITDKKANESSKTKQCWVNPADVRFTQESIGSHFQARYQHFSLMEAVAQIKAGKMSADDFPRLQVMSYSGCLWSADNRRLWVFRKANCAEVCVKIVTYMHPRFKGVIDYPSRCRKLSKSDFLPRVTVSKNVLPLPTPVASINLQRRVEETINLQVGALEPVALPVAVDISAMAGRTEANEDVIGLLSVGFKVFLFLSVLYIFF